MARSKTVWLKKYLVIAEYRVLTKLDALVEYRHFMVSKIFQTDLLVTLEFINLPIPLIKPWLMAGVFVYLRLDYF